MIGKTRRTNIDPLQDEVFLQLLVSARGDEKERATLLSILELAPIPRKMALNSLVIQLRTDKAPPDFVRAWEFLQDDEVAEAALKVLSEPVWEPNPRLGFLLVLLALLLVAMALSDAGLAK